MRREEGKEEGRRVEMEDEEGRKEGRRVKGK